MAALSETLTDTLAEGPATPTHTPPTVFHAPTRLDDALALLAGADPVRPLAGGSDLIVQMRDVRSHRHAGARIVDLKRIPELIGIRADGADGLGFWIGAATPCVQITEHAALREAWPGVVEAAGLIGSPQVQGRASLGGNLCNGSPAADSVPALVAAGAVAVVARARPTGGGHTLRELPVEALPQGPGRTTLAADELLLAIRLPAPPAAPARSADAYLRLIPRSEMDIAVVGCGVALELDVQGRVAQARVALGAVAPTVRRVPAAAEALRGTALDDAALQALAAAVRAACAPIDDKRGSVAYRIHVAGVLAQRAARIAWQRAQARGAAAF
jgi:carbon-monoxide dehydrogenase medium subunit